MYWTWTIIIYLATLESILCLSDLEKQCVANFNEDFNSDILLGTWYRVMKFTLFSGMVPTSECPTIIHQKPNATEVRRYKDEYLTPHIPYSFEDNPILEDSGPKRPDGLVIGRKQAKFFIMDPDTKFFRPLFDVMIYQQINDGFILYHECNSRGHIRWLLSKTRNPSTAEVEAIIISRPDIVRMQRQWFCAP